MAPPEVVSTKPCPPVPAFKERPILFSAPMVRALLDGSKTQTRRVVKITHRTPGLATCLEPSVGAPRPRVAAELCPYGQPGDRLWVRETFVQGWEHGDDGCPAQFDTEGNELPMKTWYRATSPQLEWCTDGENSEATPWRPSIHMPRAASRIDLEVTGVRVERLQYISEADARAEGASFHDGRGIGHSGWRHDHGDVHADARSAYARLWEQINGAGSWKANPWVWVIEFNVVRP